MAFHWRRQPVCPSKQCISQKPLHFTFTLVEECTWPSMFVLSCGTWVSPVSFIRMVFFPCVSLWSSVLLMCCFTIFMFAQSTLLMIVWASKLLIAVDEHSSRSHSSYRHQGWNSWDQICLSLITDVFCTYWWLSLPDRSNNFINSWCIPQQLQPIIVFLL